MMNRMQGIAAASLLLASLGVAGPLAAQSKKAPSDPTQDAVMMSGGFLSAHPDLRFRMHGQDRLKDGKHEDALAFFKRAAYYGDKPSQGMVAEMLWNGQGAPRDRAQAYAWMDLAAERGYEGFVLLRERYWNALEEADRARAIELGQDVYAQYGDAAAEPRLANVLRRERRRQTGSRTGFTGNLQILIPGPGGIPLRIDGSKYYDERYWEPEQYRAWQDSVWMKPRTGRVDVGAVEQVSGSSRVPPTAPKADAEEPQTPPVDDESGLGTQPPR